MADERITPQGYDYPNKVVNPFWEVTEGGTDNYEELKNEPKIKEALNTEQENALKSLS